MTNNPDNPTPENSNPSNWNPEDKFPSAKLTANTILIAGGVVFAFGAYNLFNWLLGG